MRLLGACLCLCLLACHHAEEPSPSAAPARPGRFGTAAITGRVRLVGPPPPPPHPARLGFPECARFAAEGPADPGLVVSAQGGIRDAFVWIRDGLPEGDYPVPATPVTLDQRRCEFTPRVFGIQVGQALDLRNTDPLLHNVHAAAGFNVPMPQAGAQLTRRFSRPGVMTPVVCDVHNWMRAFAGVTRHPFWATTDAEGAFVLSRLPAGRYTLELWQERLGWQSRTVEVGAGQTATVDFALRAR
jgi:plastocyanin